MLAAIDAGSNTLRLLLGEVIAGKVVPKLYLRRICRLAGGFTEEEGLSPAAMERTLLAFHDFAETCRDYEVTQVKAIATAAFRQSVNGEQFASKVRSKTSLPLEIISGELEAKYMVAGVLSALEPLPEQSLIVDIGGGSTEFVLCARGEVIWSRSMPLGVVRLTEGHTSIVVRDKYIDDMVAELTEAIKRVCKAVDIDFTKLELVGTAGTVTTLAALDMQMTEYDWRRVNNYTLTASVLRNWESKLMHLTVSEREVLPGMEVGRGDLIPAGLAILLRLIQRMNNKHLIVSDFGILEGLLVSMYSGHKT